jgi:hypothetical protein
MWRVPKHTNNKTFLSKITAPNVVKLHRCITKPIFLSLSKLVRQSWEVEHNEKKVASVFFSQYVDMKNFNVWNCGATGIPGLVGDNNPHEQTDLEIKGGKTFHGLINIGRDTLSMFTVELPQLVRNFSLLRVGVS